MPDSIPKTDYEEIQGELLALLSQRPEYGVIGLNITFHQGKLVKVSTIREVSRKAGK